MGIFPVKFQGLFPGGSQGRKILAFEAESKPGGSALVSACGEQEPLSHST
ncbi:MAG: hypothetical protein PVF73_01985 [Bacteroidales bacterium]|jgi:hypothetical protein